MGGRSPPVERPDRQHRAIRRLSHDKVRARVLPVVAFVAFWVVLGVRPCSSSRSAAGRAARATPLQSPVARRPAGSAVDLFFVVYIGFGIVVPLAFLTGNHANASDQVGGIKLTAAEKSGRELFGEHCGVCHTLAAANAVGKVGPNLDTLKPPASLVLHTIHNGCLQKPAVHERPQNCLGQGTMPAEIVQGQEAQDVAQFVGKVAGKE